MAYNIYAAWAQMAYFMHVYIYRTFSSVMGQLVMDDEVMHIMEESVTYVYTSFHVQ